MGNLKTIKCICAILVSIITILLVFSCQNPMEDQNLPGDDNDGDGVATLYDVDEITLLSPDSNSTVDSVTPTLTVYKFDPGTVSRYHIQINTSSDFTGTMVLDKDDYTSNECIVPVGKLLDGETYHWQAKAYDGEKWSDHWAGPSSFDIYTGSEYITSPDTDEAITDTTPLLDWSDIAGAAGYRILIYDYSDLATAIMDDDKLSSSSYQVNTPLLLDNRYMWTVIPKNADGIYGMMQRMNWFYTSLYESPKNPVPLNNSEIYIKYPILDWDDVNNAVNYHIQVSTNSDFSAPAIVEDVTSSISEYQLTVQLNHDETYYWRVQSGNEDFSWGYWGSVWSFTVSELDAPSGPVPANGSEIYITEPKLYWNDINQAAGYHVQISTAPSFSGGEIIEENTTTISEYQPAVSLNYDQTYYWRVQAKNTEDDWHSWGTVWSFTPSQLEHFPKDGSFAYSSKPGLDWEDTSADSTSYRVQLNTASDFSGTNVCDEILPISKYTVQTALADGTTYYWRILTRNTAGDWAVNWCDTFNFTTRQPVEHVVSSNYSSPVSVQAEDIDGDGDQDILVASDWEFSITWFENDGSQNFTEHTIYDGTIYGGRSAYAVDVDGDGYTDVIGCLENTELGWFENDGSQNFSANHIVWKTVNSVSAVDIDADGDIDIYGILDSSDQIALWLNDGDEIFTESAVSSSFNGAKSISVIDLDKDGDLDFLGAASVSDEVAWWRNNGSEVFTKVSVTTSFNGAQAAQAVDMDNDGDIDILGAGNDGITCWFNDGNQLFTEQAIEDSEYCYTIWVEDVNSDGNKDFFTTTTTNDIFLYENGGNNNYTKHTLSDAVDSPYSIKVEDIDKDGDPDVVVASYHGDLVKWWEMEY